MAGAGVRFRDKDPVRYGGRSLNALVHHIGAKRLVGWAWAGVLRETKRRRSDHGPNVTLK